MKKLLLAACAVLAMTGVARGEDLKPYTKVGAWEVLFDRRLCMASATYTHNDTVLSFGVTAGGIASIAILNPKWNIPEGKYEIRSAIDGGVPANFTANANNQIVSWSFTLGENNISLLSKGTTLHVYIGDTEYGYGLAGSAAMLSTLVQCASKIAADANPFNGQQPAAPVSTPSNPFKRT